MAILAGDLGGTKTLLAICDERGEPLCTRQYKSRAYESFEHMVAQFLADPEVAALPRPHSAGFGVAGPVMACEGETDIHGRPLHQRALITNLEYAIETTSLRRAFGLAEIRLANDFYVTALYVSRLCELIYQTPSALPEGTLAFLHNPETVRPEPLGNVCVLGAGTGMGQALVVRSDGWRPLHHPAIVATEGGHSDFAPRDEIEIELLRYLRRLHTDHVSVERVLSGSGLYALYEFFRERTPDKESAVVRDALVQPGADPPAVISQHALADSIRDPLCNDALERFIMLYGAEAGNLALKSLATGGVFLGGGIARKVLPRMQDGVFLSNFVRKGRFRALCERIPIYILLDPLAGLRGAAYLIDGDGDPEADTVVV